VCGTEQGTGTLPETAVSAYGSGRIYGEEIRYKKGDGAMNGAENLRAFLRFVTECQALNEMARKEISKEEKRQQDLLHEIAGGRGY